MIVELISFHFSVTSQSFWIKACRIQFLRHEKYISDIIPDKTVVLWISATGFQQFLSKYRKGRK